MVACSGKRSLSPKRSWLDACAAIRAELDGRALGYGTFRTHTNCTFSHYFSSVEARAALRGYLGCPHASTFLTFTSYRRPATDMYHKTMRFLVFVLLAATLCLCLPGLPSGHNVHQQAVIVSNVNRTKPEHGYAPPFHTAGRHIVDAHGHRFKLASINWYGASDIYFVPGGLESRHRSEIAATIKEMGFNSVRFPYSDQMVVENPIIPPEHIKANLDLFDGHELGDNRLSDRKSSGLRALDVYKACIEAMTDAGLAVIPNNHITNAHWCDGKNLCDASWKNSHYGSLCKIHQTTETWMDHWKTIMEPHIHNPLVIGADLRNEPRGLWGTITWNSWATAAEKASEALLAMQPNWLMFIEGISSANDCSGATDRPVELSVSGRVVYSSHVSTTPSPDPCIAQLTN